METRRIGKGVITITNRWDDPKLTPTKPPTQYYTFNWEHLRQLTELLPDDLDKSIKKQLISPNVKTMLENRDKGKCYICNHTFDYGSNNPYVHNGAKTYKMSQLHHIIPNGTTEPENIVTLCVHCHQIVHQILFVMGKWKYAKPI